MLAPLFISHGSPMLAITKTPAHDFLAALGRSMRRPRAIVVASAHFETDVPAVSRDPAPGMIYDFFGFPPALSRIVYPASGDPALADALATAIEAAGLPVTVADRRGLDHGIWVPLSLMFPDADIPVVALAIQPGFGPEHHARLGAALRDVLGDDVLLIGSGSLTHNLYELRGPDSRIRPVDAPVEAWAQAFSDWVRDRLAAGDREAALDYRARAPYAERNHPTDEHLLPLFVAMGAAGDCFVGKRLHSSPEYGGLMMDVYAFEPAA